jgi:hypothetical protein
MTIFVVTQNVAHLYAEPDTSSALASQAVLGERVTIAEEQNGFVQITTEDQYVSWIDKRLLAAQSDLSDLLSTTIAMLFADVYAYPDARSEILTKLTAGTHIAQARRIESGDWVSVRLPDGGAGYIHQVNLNSTHDGDRFQLAGESGLRRVDVVSALGINIAETAKRLVGTPYLWGGTTPFGIDCSGLTQLAYKLNGIQLLRDAQLQFADKRFGRVEEEQSLETAILDAGDLLAFSRRDDGRPTHIGIALGDGRFLHSRGGRGVRMDFCDSEEYALSYLGAVRLSADADFGIQSA